MTEKMARSRMALMREIFGALQCDRCAHYLNNGGCKAFSDVIPYGILRGDFDHRFPFDGDRGIQFQPLNQAAECA